MLRQEFKTKDIARVNREAGREEGREKGREEGEISKALSIARGLLSTKLTIDEITRVTGLTREEVDHLRMMNS